MKSYCAGALEYLSHAYDPQRALFSYSTTVGPDGEIVNDWRMPYAVRYTINTYLGLVEAERHGGQIEWLGEVEKRVDRFLAGYEIANCGDHGLLLVLLSSLDKPTSTTALSLHRVERALEGGPAALNMQELAWMLWGTTAWAREPRAQALADRLFEVIRTRFVHPESGMPRHSLRRYRAHTVSFGSVVYFLRAMYEYGETFHDDRARELFARCLDRVLSLQGDDGGWPWLLDVRSARPIDVYPIFSVHQDSMAMLFLLPARERHGIEVDAAIERSIGWNLGCNELGASLVRDEPCPWFYRSIERAERWPRARRYLRGLGPARGAGGAAGAHVRFNRECRSYHLGWVLYVWSAPSEAGLGPDATGKVVLDLGDVRGLA
jgi:hypothetical protein